MAKAKKGAAKKAAAKKAKTAPRRSMDPLRKAKAAKKGKQRWTAPGAKDRAREAKEATRTPKQEPLIKGLRIRPLDNICGRISDTRAAIARLQGEEADFERTAHDLMKKHDQMTWQHAGVVLARIPGDEKLRVTTVRSRGPAPAETAGDETDDTPIDEQAPVSQTPERQAAVDDVDTETAEGGLTH
jgi:hypothetical protein